jgi:hypothetical protein
MSTEIRNSMVYHSCQGCRKRFREDDVSWATPDGKLDTMAGDPYCDACLPEDHDDD